MEDSHNEATSVDLEGNGNMASSTTCSVNVRYCGATERLGILDCSPERDGF